jgi:hypothetical protein
MKRITVAVVLAALAAPTSALAATSTGAVRPVQRAHQQGGKSVKHTTKSPGASRRSGRKSHTRGKGHARHAAGRKGSLHQPKRGRGMHAKRTRMHHTKRGGVHHTKRGGVHHTKRGRGHAGHRKATRRH